MKNQISILLVACFISIAGLTQPTWQQVNSPIADDLVSVCFIDQHHGWILSQQGTLISTSNGGQTWQTATIGTGTFTSVQFTGMNHGCITGYQDSSFIMITNDGGENWDMPAHKKAERLNDVYFHDNNTAWVVGIKDNMNYNLYTADGGQNWAEQMNIFTLEAELFSVSFRNALEGNTCGAAGAFYTTSSGGATGWAMNISIPSLGIDVNSVFNWGMQTGCAVGSNGTALYTINKWGSYVETTTNTSSTLNAVSGDPATNKLWAVGEEGTIIYTPSYVLGWVVQPSGVTRSLYDVDMIDENNGWAVGSDGTILRFGVGTAVNEYESLTTVSVFPNPGKGMFNIEYEVVKIEYICLKVYDSYGREVATLVDEKQAPGKYSLPFDASEIRAGVYSYQLISMPSGKKGFGKIVVVE